MAAFFWVIAYANALFRGFAFRSSLAGPLRGHFDRSLALLGLPLRSLNSLRLRCRAATPLFAAPTRLTICRRSLVAPFACTVLHRAAPASPPIGQVRWIEAFRGRLCGSLRFSKGSKCPNPRQIGKPVWRVKEPAEAAMELLGDLVECLLDVAGDLFWTRIVPAAICFVGGAVCVANLTR